MLFYIFTFAINLWHRKFVTADVAAVSLNNQHGMKRREQDFDETFIWNQYEERLAILNTENIKICGWTTKLEVIKVQYVCISAMSAEYGYCRTGFYSKFRTLSSSAKILKIG